MTKSITAGIAVANFLGATTVAEKKIALALTRECPAEAARILAAAQAS